MKALVTGGGGFLGTRIVQMLVARGDTVTVLGRGRYPHHERAGVPSLQTDINDAAAVQRACRDMDVVFHVAALAGIWGKPRTFWDTNVSGTRTVIDACRSCGVPKLVFTSSPSVVFGNRELCGVDESEPYPARFLADYPRSKAAAEQLVLAANGDGLSTVALRPHLIFGPGDPHILPRIVARARAGQLLQVGDGTNLVDITYVDNAAEAHLRAADALSPDSACAGRAYFISQGEPVRLWQWINGVLEGLGVPSVTRHVSPRLAYGVGAAMEVWHRLTRSAREPRMTRFLALQLAHSHYFNISAARRDLGYVPRVSTADATDATVEWLRTQGP
ncbi:MAG: NAD-dependent epimerase/dehydratase family protein [Planctomycetes bacterium]|nr:NAD-dependent epimerase/dehydratase family protein [Planctomycetota bacterium]